MLNSLHYNNVHDRYADDKNWFPLWLETDSSLVVATFDNVNLVTWHLLTRWSNCLACLYSKTCNISQIYWEGNNCANHMANLGLSVQGFLKWDSLADFLRDDYLHIKVGFPFYRFCSSKRVLPLLLYIDPLWWLFLSSIIIGYVDKWVVIILVST